MDVPLGMARFETKMTWKTSFRAPKRLSHSILEGVCGLDFGGDEVHLKARSGRSKCGPVAK